MERRRSDAAPFFVPVCRFDGAFVKIHTPQMTIAVFLR
jgi:hypothetical protein